MTCESRRDMKKQFFKASKSDQSMKREEIIHTILVLFFLWSFVLEVDEATHENNFLDHYISRCC